MGFLVHNADAVYVSARTSSSPVLSFFNGRCCRRSCRLSLCFVLPRALLSALFSCRLSLSFVLQQALLSALFSCRLSLSFVLPQALLSALFSCRLSLTNRFRVLNAPSDSRPARHSHCISKVVIHRSSRGAPRALVALPMTCLCGRARVLRKTSDTTALSLKRRRRQARIKLRRDHRRKTALPRWSALDVATCCRAKQAWHHISLQCQQIMYPLKSKWPYEFQSCLY